MIERNLSTASGHSSKLERKTTIEIIEQLIIVDKKKGTYFVPASKYNTPFIFLNPLVQPDTGWVRLDQLQERWIKLINSLPAQVYDETFLTFAIFQRDVFGDAEESLLLCKGPTLSNKTNQPIVDESVSSAPKKHIEIETACSKCEENHLCICSCHEEKLHKFSDYVCFSCYLEKKTQCDCGHLKVKK